LAALLPDRVDPHPLGCHRRRISDRIVFDKLLCVLVFGSGYERIADTTCSDRTLRRRRDEWTALGVMQQLWHLALAAYDRMIGLELSDLAIDGCITKAPCGGEVAGRSPVDRSKHGLKRSMATDATGTPLGVVPAAASRNDHTLLGATLDALEGMGPLAEATIVHLDRGYDHQVVREVLAERGLLGQIAPRGVPAPIQLGRRWVIERAHAWGNTFGKLRWCTERRRQQVEFYLARWPVRSSLCAHSSAGPACCTGGMLVPRPGDSDDHLLPDPLSIGPTRMTGSSRNRSGPRQYPRTP
jgi:transposase